jgi:Protein of unknown function (DUF3592)
MARRRKKKVGKPDMRMSHLLFSLAAIAFAIGAWAAVQGAATLRWPRVTAKIVDATLTLHERETRDRPDQRHTFAVHYQYAVGGRDYVGGAIEPYDLGMQNSAGAVKMRDRFPVGSAVQVAYNPNNPAEAYLMPGPSSFSLILLGLGVAFALVGGLARRMIRVGPGDDDEDDEQKPVPKKRNELDPSNASFYPKRSPTELQP